MTKLIIAATMSDLVEWFEQEPQPIHQHGYLPKSYSNSREIATAAIRKGPYAANMRKERLTAEQEPMPVDQVFEITMSEYSMPTESSIEDFDVNEFLNTH